MALNELIRCALLSMCITATGCGVDAPAPQPQQGRADNERTAELALTTTERRGVWVYETDWMKAAAGQDAFMDFARSYGINNVYISLKRADVLDGLLSAGELPGFLKRLIGNGIRGEALLADADCATDDQHASMIAKINAVRAYNDRQGDSSSRFLGVHLDVEPWIGTGTSTSWVDGLIGCYQASRRQLSGTSMTLVADVSGTKALLASDMQRQAMLDAVTRLVLMQYQEPDLSVVAGRTAKFFHGVQAPVDPRGLVVALRVQDFSDATDSNAFNANVAAVLDRDLSSQPGYVGWALFNYYSGKLQ